MSELITNIACPPPSRVVLPIVVAPSFNVTVPVGVPPAPVTVAVNVTGVPGALGLADDERAAALALWTTAYNTADVLPRKLASPP